MITVAEVKDLLAATRIAYQHVPKIDAAIRANAVAGWSTPIHYQVQSHAIGLALETIYAAGGWYVQTKIEERDRIGNEQTFTFILGFPT